MALGVRGEGAWSPDAGPLAGDLGLQTSLVSPAPALASEGLVQGPGRGPLSLPLFGDNLLCAPWAGTGVRQGQGELSHLRAP